MKRFLLSIMVLAVIPISAPPVVFAAEIQNWLYVSGNSPKETRTSVAQGTATGFGVANLQGVNIGNQVALSEGSVHLLDTSGRVWGWGSDGREVGTGTTSAVIQPRIIQFPENITQIASGNNHSLALSESGKVFAWGWNGHGQLGVGAYVNYEASWQYSSPVQLSIPGGRTVKRISAGGYQSFAIASDNTIWGWGINENYSILGTGGYSSVYTPTLIRVPNGFIPIKVVTNGGRYTLVLGQNGSVIGWGSNGNFGAYGLGVSGEIESPTQIFRETASIVDIAVNGAATYVLDANGIVFSAGYNGYGQLGSTIHPAGESFAKVALPSTFKAEKIFAVNSNAWAVSSNGQSYTWGAGSNDTLGTGYTGAVFTPVLLSTLKDYGILSLAGNSTQTFVVVSNQANIKAAAELQAKQEAAAKAALDAKVAADLASAAAIAAAIELGISIEKSNKTEIQAKLEDSKTRLLQAQGKLAAATSEEARKIYASAVESWNAAIRAYQSKLNEIELSIKNLEAAKVAKAAADKAAAELKAKQEAEAKAAAELKAKQEAEAKAAAELKAKQEAEAKAAADKAALAKAQSELVAANAALADAQKVNRELQAQLNSVEAQFKILSDSVSLIQGQVSQLNSKLAAALAGQNALSAKLKKVCSAKPKPKGC